MDFILKAEYYFQFCRILDNSNNDWKPDGEMLSVPAHLIIENFLGETGLAGVADIST